MRWRSWFTALLIAVIGAAAVANASALVVNGSPAPEIAEGAWINTQPLTMQALRGRVVLVEFWTYG